jgi:uncharacterized RDD family membrane protein YckC
METTLPHIAVEPSMQVPWYKRLLNLIIDVAAIFIIIILIGVVAFILSLLGYDGLINWMVEIDGLTDRLFTALIMVVYLFIMEVTTQRTLGKYITGTMVVMEDGSKPEARSIIIRALCRILTIEALSFIREVPRGWHDTASGTYVVDAKKYMAAYEMKKSFAEIGTS